MSLLLGARRMHGGTTEVLDLSLGRRRLGRVQLVDGVVPDKVAFVGCVGNQGSFFLPGCIQ